MTAATVPFTAGEDTITAFSTAIGGPVAVIRVSGDRACRIAARVWRGRRRLEDPPYRTLLLGNMEGAEGEIDNQVLAAFMPAPRSYTGEDMVELYCHGGVLSARLALLQLLKCGARHAAPGEFTKRAFINGKMDLTQAEAVADVIEAHSEAALRLANRQLQGMLGARVNAVHEDLIRLLSEVEARLDFPEDDLNWMAPAELDRELASVTKRMQALLQSRNEGEILRHGVQLVIAGPPNVGKSSLMNAILGRDRAIVTHIPGTTRDTLEELAHIRGIPVRLVDTAGIREARDLIEKSGIERTRASIERAQIVLWVVDVSRPSEPQAWHGEIGGAALILVGNKKDLLPSAAARPPPGQPAPVYTCALTGEGLEQLSDVIEETVWEAPHRHESDVAVNARHAALLADALTQIEDARQQMCAENWEMAAVSLRAGLWAVGLLTGQTVAPDILDAIFSRFCIGK